MDLAGRRAAEVFSVEVVEPSRRAGMWRTAISFVVGALTEGGGPTNPGGRRIEVRDRATGDPLATHPERAFDDGHLLLGQITQALESQSAEDFAARWIDGHET